ncbi:MAG: lysophospholipid acyltransferase family protein [Pseudomonadota bacterium]
MSDTREEKASVEKSTIGEALAFLRTRVFDLYVLVMSLGVGLSILVYYRWTKRPREVRGLLRFWSRNFIYGAWVLLGVRYRLVGLNNIPDQPVIFAGNHQSYFESIAMTVFFPHINVITKRASMKIPVFGWGLEHAPMIPVDRDAPGQNIRRLLREGCTSVKNGRSILIFPEGGRVPVFGRRPFQRGVERLYAHAKVPVVPFVTNAGRLWPSGFGTKRPGTITMHFLPPIPPGIEPDRFATMLEDKLNTEKDRL